MRFQASTSQDEGDRNQFGDYEETKVSKGSKLRHVLVFVHVLRQPTCITGTVLNFGVRADLFKIKPAGEGGSLESATFGVLTKHNYLYSLLLIEKLWLLMK